jgi:hypothetical protein
MGCYVARENRTVANESSFPIARPQFWLTVGRT